MESPYVNKNGQKLEEQMKPDAQITQKLDKTLFSLHSEKNKKPGKKVLQLFPSSKVSCNFVKLSANPCFLERKTLKTFYTKGYTRT